MAAKPKSPVLHDLTERIGEIEALDTVAERVAAPVDKALGAQPVKDLLSGTWLGHALHPLMTDLPIGTWTSALLLDLIGGRQSRPAAERLVGVGLLAALPTVASGLSDWSDTGGQVRRMGVVHAAANSASLVLYSASYIARKRRRRRLGVALGLAGGGALAVGGYIGGHLSYARGVGVDQNAFQEGAQEWTFALPESELRDGVAAHAVAGGVDLLLVKQGGRVLALSDRCNHRGGPLHEGRIEDGCVTCPLHGSSFSLADGSVLRGPATGPQPAWETRVIDGRVEVRAPHLHQVI